MHSTIMDLTVGTFVGIIVEPIDVLTTDIHIPMEDIILTPTGDIILTSTGDRSISETSTRTRTLSAKAV
jgi:hypothetical protein